MTHDDAIGAVFQRLWKGIELTWQVPPRTPPRPLTARPHARWRTWAPQHPSRLHQDAPNWFYATLVFPAELHGHRLAGEQAYIYINGYCPFTFWLDGRELYQEEHAWYATGPLADPIMTAIEPGREYRLVLCLEPTDLPYNCNPLNVSVNALPVVQTVFDILAVHSELKLAEALASTPAEQALVTRAGASLDLAALAADRWPEFLASAAAMEQILAPLAPRAKAHTLHLIGHTHIDMDWQWTWKDTLHCIRRDFHSVLNLMADRPEVKFSLSQVPSYAAVQQHDPANFARVQEYVRQGRWENLAATWVEGDLNMADGESLARHLLYAADWSRAHLGQAARAFWAPDTFGHPGNMPQIATLGECDTYFHWRCNPGGDANWPARRWTGIDGTEIVSFSSAYGGGLLPAPWMFSLLANTRDYMRAGFRRSHYVWGLGDHGGGLPRHQLALLARVKDRPLLPTICFSALREFRDALLADGTPLSANRGETHTLFEGCYTTHARMKRYNRRCENALLTAETLAALAGLDRTCELRNAWTPILFSQFHDIYCGCAIPGSYRDADARAEASLATAAKVAQEAGETLIGALPRAPLGRGTPSPDPTWLGHASGRPTPNVCACPVVPAAAEPATGVGAVRGSAPEPPMQMPVAADRQALCPRPSGTRPGAAGRPAVPAAGASAVMLQNVLGFDYTGPVTLDLPPDVAALTDAAGRVLSAQPLDETGRALVVAHGIPAFAPARWTPLASPSPLSAATAPDDAAMRAAPVDMDPCGVPGAEVVAVKEEGDYFAIETPWARLKLAKCSGAIGSLFDQRLGRELVAYGVPRTLQHVAATRSDMALNVFQILDEADNRMPAWLMNDVLRQENLLRGAAVTLLGTGPVCARFRVVHAFRASRLEEEVRIYRDLPWIECLVDVDWAEPGSPEKGIPHLKLAFAANLTAARVHSEGPFTVREVPANGVQNVTQKWVDVTGDEAGFTLLNDACYGFDASGGCVRMSLVRNSYNPDPDSDRGRHSFRFLFIPHGPTFDPGTCVRQGLAFNRPPVVVATASRGSAPTTPAGAVRAPAPRNVSAPSAAEPAAVALPSGMSPEPPVGDGVRRREEVDTRPLESPDPRRPGCSAPWLTITGAPHVVCTALRRAEHDPEAVILRLFETAGQAAAADITVPAAFVTAQEINFLEAPVGLVQSLSHGRLQLQFRAYEIKSLRLQRHAAG